LIFIEEQIARGIYYSWLRCISSDLENREYGRWETLHCRRYTRYPQKLRLASQTSGGRSIGIVHTRTKATEFDFVSVAYPKKFVSVRQAS
jgi:hypothetical protein